MLGTAAAAEEEQEREEGESAADFGKRLQNERVLALNPNFEQQ